MAKNDNTAELLISFGWSKKQLQAQLVAIDEEIEKSDATIEVKTDLRKTQKEIKGLIDQLDNNIKKISNEKVSTKQFETYKLKTTNAINAITDKLDGLYKILGITEDEMGALGANIDLSKPIQEMEAMLNQILAANEAMEKLVDTTKGMGVSTRIKTVTSEVQMAYDDLATSISNYNKIGDIDTLKKGDKDSLNQYSKIKSEKRFAQELAKIEAEVESILERREAIEEKISSMEASGDKTSDAYFLNQKALAEVELEYAAILKDATKLLAVIDSVNTTYDKEGLPISTTIPDSLKQSVNYVSGYVNELDEVEEHFTAILKLLEENIEKSNVLSNIVPYKDMDKAINEGGQAGSVAIGVRFKATKKLYEQLDKKLVEIQDEVNKRNIITVPVKLVVEGTPYAESQAGKSLSDSARKAAKKTEEEVSVDINKAVKRSYTNALKSAENGARQSISEIKKVFDDPKNAIKIRIAPPTKTNINEVKKSIKNEQLVDGLNITDEIAEATKRAQELIDSLEAVKENLSKIQSESDGLKLSSATNDYSSILTEINDATQMLSKIDLGRIRENIAQLVILMMQTVEGIRKINVALKSLGTDQASTETDEFATKLSEVIGKIDTLLSELTTLSESSKLSLKDLDESFQNINVFELLTSLQNIDKYIHQIREDSDALGLSQAQLDSFIRLEKAVRGAAESLTSIRLLSQSGSLFDEPNSKLFSSISRSLKKINDLGNVKDVFSGIKITKKMLNNIQELGPALETVANQLRVIDTTNYFGFLNQLNELTKNATALHDLAVVLSKTKNGGINFGTPSMLSNQFNQADKYSNLVKKLSISSSEYTQEYTKSLDLMSSKIAEIQKMKGLSVVTNEDIEKADRLLIEIEDIRNNLVSIPRLAQDASISKLTMRMQEYKATLTRMGTKDAREQIDLLIKRLQTVGLSVNDLREVANEFNVIKANIAAAGKQGTSLIDAIKTKLKYGWAQTFAMFFSFYDIIRYIREISSTVTELNSNLIELAKVSNSTIGQLYNNFSDFYDIAKETGGTINDIIQSTADWARNGYNLSQSKDLARFASIFQNIGDGLSEDQANEYLVSILKGFRLEAEDTMQIMDIINNVSNNAASSVANIGEALERSSSAFGAANTNLKESVALLTTANEVLQSPETVGTAFKSMSARLRSSTTELEELGEEATLTTSKLRAMVKALTGVDIQKDENTFKSIYDILLEIGNEWEHLTDVEQASLSEALFGKRNAQVGFSILNNVDRLQEIYQLAEESAGSALTEQEKYLQGVQYQIDRFQASVENLANTFMSSDVLKGAISLGTDFVDLLNKIIDKLGAVPPLIATIAGALSLKGIGIDSTFLGGIFGKPSESLFADSDLGLDINIDAKDNAALLEFENTIKETNGATKELSASMLDSSSSASQFMQNFKNIEGVLKGEISVVDEYSKHLESLQQKQVELNLLTNTAQRHTLANAKLIMSEYNQGLKNTTLSQKEFTQAVSDNWTVLGKYLTSVKMGSATLGGFALELTIATAKMVAMKVAAMATQMVLVTLASFIVSKVIEAIDEMIVTSKEAIEIGEQAKQEVEDINATLKNQQKTIKETAQRFAELSQGIDQVSGKNLSLSDEDYQEFLDISNELAEVFPSLSRHYDENGNAIVKLNGNVNTITQSLQNLLETEEKLARQEILGKAPDVFTGIKGDIEELTKETNIMLEKMDDVETFVDALESIGAKGLSVTYKGTGAKAYAEKIHLYDLSFLSQENIDRIEEEYGEEVASLVKQLNGINRDIVSKYESLSSYLSLYLYDNFDFARMSDEMQAAVQEVVNSLNINNIEGIEDWDDLTDWINKNILQVFTDNPNLSAQYDLSLDASTKFNNDEISFEEYEEEINKILPILDKIEGLDPQTKKAILLSVGLDENEGIVSNAFANNLKASLEKSNIDKKVSDYIVGKLNKSELEALYSLDIDWNEVLGVDDYQKAVEKMTQYQKHGNVDLFNRPLVSGAKMIAAGWTEEQYGMDAESIATVFSSAFDIVNAKGEKAIVHVTPILPDGSVLSPEELEDYVYNTLQGTNNALDADNKGIVLKVDENVETDAFGQVTEAAWEAADAWDISLHEVQDKVLLQGKLTGEKALQMVKQYVQEISSIPFEINLDKSQLSSTTDGIKEIQSAYQSLYDKWQDGKVGSDLAFLISDLDDLKEKLVDAEGKAIEWGDIWDENAEILTDGTHSFEEMETAINKLLTYYVNSTVALENFDKEEAALISTQLQLAGVTKKSADSYVQSMAEIASAIDEAEEAGKKFTNISAEEIMALKEEKGWSEQAAQGLIFYAIKKQLANGLTLQTDADIKNLQSLLTWVNVTSDALNEYIKLKSLLDSLEGQVVSQKRLDTIQNRLNELKNQASTEISSAIAEEQAKMAALTQDQAKAAKSSSGKEEDAWKEAYEKELAELDHYHEMGLISDISYYEERERLNDKYFKDREKYTEEYNKNLEEIYKGFQSAYKQYVDDMSDYWEKSLEAGQISFQKYCNNMESMLKNLFDSGKIDAETYYTKMADYYGSIVSNYDKAINAAQRLIKKRIDALNDQKEAIEKSYKSQIEVIQKEIDALKEANEERQKELDLQKALYELNRAQNQRKDFRYESDKGFVYRANEKDIKAAQEVVEQTQFEMYVSTLEKKIESLETEMENLTSAIDDQIDNLQDYSDRLGEVANKWEEAQEDMVAASIWGSNWQNEILATSETLLSEFTANYIAMEQQQADMAVAAANVIVEAYNKQIEALNKWKEALASSNTTGGTGGLNKKDITPKDTGKPKDDTKRNVAARVNASMTSAAINKQYAKYNDRLAKHYSYGTGTDKAKPGYHEIAENGDEIILDNYGNAYIAKGHQLHRFEGGEKVFDETETKELLSGKYLPIESVLPNYSDMLNKIITGAFTPNSVGTSSVATNKTFGGTTEVNNSVNITIGDIHVTEVENASDLAKVITNKLPNALLQELNRK